MLALRRSVPLGLRAGAAHLAARGPCALRLATPRRLLCSAAGAGSSSTSQRVAVWSVRLAHDNTFLSYHRNAIIATIAGSAIVQYDKGEGRPPLAAAGLLAIGALYMYVGSATYVWQTFRLRGTLGLAPANVAFGLVNAAWPIALWSVSLACILDEPPHWLLQGMRQIESWLPSAIYSSLFLHADNLQPIVRLLAQIREEEHARMEAIEKPRGFRVRRDTLLTDDDYVTIISQRLERLGALQAKLEALADSDHAATVSTWDAMPLIDKLYAAVEQLEIALEAEVRRQEDRGIIRAFFVTTSSLPTARLIEELQAVRTLKRRCVAVKADSELID